MQMRAHVFPFLPWAWIHWGTDSLQLHHRIHCDKTASMVWNDYEPRKFHSSNGANGDGSLLVSISVLLPAAMHMGSLGMHKPHLQPNYVSRTEQDSNNGYHELSLFLSQLSTPPFHKVIRVHHKLLLLPVKITSWSYYDEYWDWKVVQGIWLSSSSWSSWAEIKPTGEFKIQCLSVHFRMQMLPFIISSHGLCSSIRIQMHILTFGHKHQDRIRGWW